MTKRRDGVRAQKEEWTIGRRKKKEYNSKKERVKMKKEYAERKEGRIRRIYWKEKKGVIQQKKRR